jgi:hypothetical protein
VLQHRNSEPVEDELFDAFAESGENPACIDNGETGFPSPEYLLWIDLYFSAS